MEDLGAIASSADVWSWDETAPGSFVPSTNYSCTPTICRYHVGMRSGCVGKRRLGLAPPLQSRPMEVTNVWPGVLLGWGSQERCLTEMGAMAIQEGLLEEVAAEVQGGMESAWDRGHLTCKIWASCGCAVSLSVALRAGFFQRQGFCPSCAFCLQCPSHSGLQIWLPLILYISAQRGPRHLDSPHPTVPFLLIS